MPAFEMTFEVPPVPDAVEDRIVELLDATIAEHLGVRTATILVDAHDCVAAAAAALDLFQHAGVTPRRLVDDLVTRTQIAERVGVTRQAVSNWVSGVRQVGSEFPPPYVLTGGGLWLWGEVVDYLRGIGVAVEEDATFPTRREAQLVADLIASARATEVLTSR